MHETWLSKQNLDFLASIHSDFHGTGISFDDGVGMLIGRPFGATAIFWHKKLQATPIHRGGVEDTRLEAKAKDTKKIRGQGQGQGQPFRGQTLSRPRTGMLEAKAKDQGHKAQVLSKKKKKRSSQKFFRRSPKKKKKKKGLHKNFSSDLH